MAPRERGIVVSSAYEQLDTLPPPYEGRGLATSELTLRQHTLSSVLCDLVKMVSIIIIPKERGGVYE